MSGKLGEDQVDKHNEGRLLKSEIVSFIQSSDIIIADLTYERPNCYLEVGYAMGLDKFRNLILTAREDHHQDSPNYKKGGPKIHFDLSGYDILLWDPNDLPGFKKELEKRVRRRLSTLPTFTTTSTSSWDEEWFSTNYKLAVEGLKRFHKKEFMEIKMTVPNSNLSIPQGELLHIADQSQIHTSGWPIGVVLNREEYRPKPRTDGINAEIETKDKSHYDYWYIRKDGTFYLLRSLWESANNPGYIFFNTRIVQITEALLYAVRLYSDFKLPSDSRILIGIRHGGLKDCTISATSSRSHGIHGISKEDEVYTEIETTCEKIESELINLVQQFTSPLFILFDFFDIDRSVLEDIVNNFVAGRVT